MPLIRVFDSAEAAAESAAELKMAGLEGSGIQVVTNSAGDASAKSFVAMGVAKARADQLAAQVAAGSAVLIAGPPFGTAARAVAILERGGTAEGGATTEVVSDIPARDPATPLSSAAGWRVLLNNPTPLSSWLKWAPLSRQQSLGGSSHGLPILSRDAAPLSSAVGMRTLSSNAAPLSSTVGMKVLKDEPAPLSSKAGLRVLSDNPTPLSSWLGLKVLTKAAARASTTRVGPDNPAPFSSMLGMKVLTEGKTTRE